MVGLATFGEEGCGASTGAPMEVLLSLAMLRFYWQDYDRFLMIVFVFLQVQLMHFQILYGASDLSAEVGVRSK